MGAKSSVIHKIEDQYEFDKETGLVRLNKPDRSTRYVWSFVLDYVTLALLGKLSFYFIFVDL